MPKKTTAKRAVGSKYKPEFCEQVTKLCRLGAIDTELADFFGINKWTLNDWKKRHPDFFAAMKKGKAESDALVGQRLFERAVGYSHPEEKIFCNDGVIVRAETVKQYAPDTTACIFWLKNRRPDLWRDRQEHEHSGKDGGAITVEIVKFAGSKKEDPASA